MTIALKTKRVIQVRFDTIDYEVVYQDFNKSIQCWTIDDDACLVVKMLVKRPNTVTETVYEIDFRLSERDGIVCRYEFIYPEDLTKALLSSCKKYENGVFYFGRDTACINKFMKEICKKRKEAFNA